MKILKTEKVFETKYLEMIKTNYENKDGNESDWFHVQRTNQPRIVVIIPVFDEATTNANKIVLIKEFRVPLNDYEYGFPAGLVDDGESIEDAIRRELKEETGLDVVRFILISPAVYNSAGMTDESVHIAYVNVRGNISTSGNEVSEDIEVMVLDYGEVAVLLATPDLKFGAKAWLALTNFMWINSIVSLHRSIRFTQN